MESVNDCVLLSWSRVPSGPADVQVSPGAYTGNWAIVGETGLLSGAETVTLGAGSYQMQVGALNSAQGGTFARQLPRPLEPGPDHPGEPIAVSTDI